VRERDLAGLGDHLARLLEQADQLVAEWKRYGDGLRGTLETQAAQLDQELSRAVEQAAHRLAPRAAQELSRELATTIDLLRRDLSTLGESVHRAVAELEGHRSEPGAGRWSRAVPLVALALGICANVLLVVLLLRPLLPGRVLPGGLMTVVDAGAGSGGFTPATAASAPSPAATGTKPAEGMKAVDAAPTSVGHPAAAGSTAAARAKHPAGSAGTPSGGGALGATGAGATQGGAVPGPADAGRPAETAPIPAVGAPGSTASPTTPTPTRRAEPARSKPRRVRPPS
jgi:hypothetical protein